MASEYTQTVQAAAAKAKPPVKPPVKPKVVAKKTTPVTPPAAPTDWATLYSAPAALVNSSAELKSLFDKAVAGKWTAANFQKQFQSSVWYQTHAQTWRDAETARTTDAGTWKQSIEDISQSIQKTAAGMGINLTADEISKLADQTAHISWGLGVNLDTLRSHIIEVGKITGKGGEVAQTIDKLKSYASSMGVQYNDSWYTDQATAVLGGKATIEDSNSTIKDLAKSKYAAFANQIDAGQTIDQIASPYMNSMANILELSPSAINLQDPTINKALTNLDPTTNQPTAQPLWQFESALKQDNRYFKTIQSHQQMADIATGIAQTFGKI